MNQFYCEKEEQIVAELRSAPLDTALARHVSSCVICSDAAAVSELLRAEVTALPSLPEPDFLWWKAELQRKQMAVERATRSIMLVRKISYLGIGAAMLWLAFSAGQSPSFISILSKLEIASAVGLRGSALVAGVGALLLILWGSLYLVRSEK